MFKFLVLCAVLVIQLDISKGHHLTAEYYDQNGQRTDKSSAHKASYEVTGIGKYEVYQSNASWADARQICNDEGGNLAVIRSVFDELIVKAILKRDNAPFVWLGLHEVRQSAVQSHWETSTEGDWVNVQTVAAWKLNIEMDKKILYGIEELSVGKCGLFTLKGGVIPAPCAFATQFICENKES